MPVADLSHSIASDASVRAKWQEALTNFTNPEVKAFKASEATDGVVLLIGHKRNYTCVNESCFPHAFSEKPKVRNTRGIDTMVVPSLCQPGQNEKVACVNYHGPDCGHQWQ